MAMRYFLLQIVAECIGPSFYHLCFCLYIFQVRNISGMVADRCGHSIAAVYVSDSCVWIMVVGGWKSTAVGVYASPVTALVELSKW